MNLNERRWLIAAIVVAILCVGGAIYRYNWWAFVDSSEYGYRYDMQTGKISVLERTGYHRITPFFSTIHIIDGRPMQIRIEANNRVLNAMLVRFKKEGVQQFVEMHGRSDYDQAQLGEILKSYAYERYGDNSYNKEFLQKRYLFLEILGNTSGSDNDTIRNGSRKSLKGFYP